MSRLSSPKLHYIESRNAERTACNTLLRNNVTTSVTVDITRVTCVKCLDTMKNG
jgi:hypothetical protein